MRKFLYKIMMAALALAAMAGCQKEDDRVMEMLAGDWHYSGTEQGVEIDVWMSFHADGTFDMWQKAGEGAYWYSAGVFDVDVQKSLLTGVYEDKCPWRYDYKYKVSGSSLTLSAVGEESHSYTYAKGTVPAEVIEKSLPLTRAAEGFVPFL